MQDPQVQIKDESKNLTADFIAKLCFDKFNSLPKTGKPSANEWTVLSAIVVENTYLHEAQVIALGTGTKCIGQNKLCKCGFILNDSHAEVLARRAFLRYIYGQLKKAVEGVGSIFQWDNEVLRFHISHESKIRFHFFSTQTPCGDACIVTSQFVRTTNYDVDDCAASPAKILKTNKMVHETDDDVGEVLSINNATVYTGAKIIHNPDGDILLQTAGTIRTKPGRGDRTLSISCSDKLAKWNIMGVQGALLDSVMAEPIYFDTLTFCSDSDRPTLIRALYGRWLEKATKYGRFKFHQPDIRVCSKNIRFQFSSQVEKQPSPNGVVWSNVEHARTHEVTVNGLRQGITKKNLNTPQAASMISKYHLLKEYINLVKLQPILVEHFQLQLTELEKLPYRHFKSLAENYQQTWSLVKLDCFGSWSSKPKTMLEFTAQST